MQIVINIDEQMYKWVNDPNKWLDYYGIGDFIDLINNGTVLPEEHGRLKDTDKIVNDGINKGFCDWYDEIKYAPTLIEANRSEG